MGWAIPLVKAASPYIMAASATASAFQTIQAGRQQNEMYKLQAQQARLKASRDALQYEQQANMVFERLLQNNASAAARGFSGGIQGFSGSAKLIQGRNEKVAGRDINIMQQGAKEAISFGEVQANLLREAGEQARSGAYFDAFSKLGTAAYMLNMTGTGSVAAPASSSGTSLPINFSDPTLQYGVRF